MITSFRGKYSFLSNFYNSPINIEGITYPTVEHFFQAMKSEDIEVRKIIALYATPAIAKKRGRQLILRKDWESVKDTYMIKGLLAKFITHKELQNKLIATAPKQLVEGNVWGDKYWGKCNNEGLNMLGLMLMFIRNMIINSKKT